MPSSWVLEKSRSVHGLLLRESRFGQAGPARVISILCFADSHHERPQRQSERAAQQWALKSVPAGGRWRVGIGPATAPEWSNLFWPRLAALQAFPAQEARALQLAPAARHSDAAIGLAMAREWSNPSSLPLAARWVFQALGGRAPNSRSEGQCSPSVTEPLAKGMGSPDPCALSSAR